MGQNKVRDIITTDLVTLSPNNTVRDATIRLAVENISGAPVVDVNHHDDGTQLCCNQSIILGVVGF